MGVLGIPIKAWGMNEAVCLIMNWMIEGEGEEGIMTREKTRWADGMCTTRQR